VILTISLKLADPTDTTDIRGPELFCKHLIRKQWTYCPAVTSSRECK
jgi:hypothetical protein